MAGHRRRGGGAVHPREARQAARPFSAWKLPFHAIDFCLREAGIDLVDVDHFAYSYDPHLLGGQHRGHDDHSSPGAQRASVPSEWESAWDPLFLSSIVNAPRHLVGGAPHHLSARFRGHERDRPCRWHFVDHHLCHAASAFLASPFDEAAVLTIDGRGEKATTTYGLGRGNQIDVIGQVDMPHSLGMLYEQVTSYLGFLHSSDEYKVMALASFGRPRFLGDFREAIRVGRERPVLDRHGRACGMPSVPRACPASPSTSAIATSPTRCRPSSKRRCSISLAG